MVHLFSGHNTSAGVEPRCFAQERAPAGTGYLGSAEDRSSFRACGGAESGIRIGFVGKRVLTEERTMQPFNTTQKKPPARATIPAEEKLLVSRGKAAQLLSISQRGLDYLIANRRLPTRRIGGRVLIPVADLRKYVRGDHPESIVA